MVKTSDGGLTMRVAGQEEAGMTIGGASARVREPNMQSILPSLMWRE
jgi:hypothetical protein